MLNRRQFCLMTGLGVAGGLTLPRSVWASGSRSQDVELEVKELREGIHAIIGGGGNSLVIETEDGGILIDTKMPNVVAALNDHASDLLGKAPAVVINTHHHGDHTGGNYLFSDRAEIVAHANVEARLQATIDSWLKRTLLGMARQATEAGDEQRAKELTDTADGLTLDMFAADEAFDEQHTIERGNRTITLTHVVPGHTDNDAIIHLPDENIVHMGDLLFHQIHPYMDVDAGADSTGWRACLNASLELCDKETIVVPGHGIITDAAGIQGMIDYFDAFENFASRAIKDGKTREEVSEMSVPAFENYQGNRMGTNIANVYDEVLTHESNRAK